MTIRAREILDQQIADRHGRVLGRVADLILDPTVPSAACYVLISLRPEAGQVKGKTVALPWALVARAHSSAEGVSRCLKVDVAGESLNRLSNLADA